MLPASFAKDGFLSAAQLRPGKYRRLMVGTDGWANAGKTEFAISAPGPGIVLCLDRGLDGVLDNPHPPKTRRPDFAYKIIQRPMPTQTDQKHYQESWKMFYEEYKKALNNVDCRTVILDTDSDSWELQRLAEFGTLQGVVSLRYAGINAARKAMLARAWDSGKIVIGTNRLQEEYETVVNKDGKDVQVKTGKIKRQGFADWTYLWGLQLRHFKTDKGEYGVKVLMCKADATVEGLELVGDDCNFPALLQCIYPQVDLKEWGY